MELLLSFLICIFVVYGITNILVSGSIFEGLRTFMFDIENKLRNKTTVLEEDVANWKDIIPNSKVGEKYEELTNKIISEESSSVYEAFDNSLEQLKHELLIAKTNIFLSALLLVINKFNELLSCMMCSGFWVGLGFSLILMITSINVFGLPIIVLSEFNIVSLFFMACMFSGTTWIIHSLVSLVTMKNEDEE